jgi:hypothetical protein
MVSELPVNAVRLFTVTVPICPGAAVEGFTLQLAGALPEQLRLTAPVNPNGLETEIGKVVESVPAITVAVLWLDPRENAATPVPVSATVCVLLPALSEIVIVPVWAPLANGVKVIDMSQAPPAATEPAQVFACAKSPLATMLEIAKGPVPLFVR